MNFYIEPFWVAFACVGLSALTGYLIARTNHDADNERAIEDTITYLCKEGYIKHRHLSDCEIEIIPLEAEL
jgi:hypothetical protein